MELPLAEMVIHESLRLYPPNWLLVPRRCIRRSSIGGFQIPIGSWIYIFPYVIHRDARWFAAPESFDPRRFDPEVLSRVQRSAFIPLGMGRHVCVGRTLSTIILSSMLARILREFTLELPPGNSDLTPQAGIVIQPESGLPLIVTRDTSA